MVVSFGAFRLVNAKERQFTNACDPIYVRFGAVKLVQDIDVLQNANSPIAVRFSNVTFPVNDDRLQY